nr:precorrin-6y C5,15-methyltransferase (decarboxylating) subunit CbiE [Leptotrichia sp. OH3620_COT-345]
METLKTESHSLKYTFMIKIILNSIKNINIFKLQLLILSGDTGFYSMLTFMRKKYSPEELEAVPGILSIQYMFARISDYRHDAYVGSVHGKELDYIKKLKEYRKVGLLTDKNNTLRKIARIFTENALGETTVYIGENLSYPNEKIYKFKAEELKDHEEKFEMNVVILFR